MLYRTLQPPTAVSAAAVVDSGSDSAVLLLQDSLLGCYAADEGGLQQSVTWRAAASLLQMVQLPSRHLLVIAEGGHCSLHCLQQPFTSSTAPPPRVIGHTVLQAPAGTSRNHVQPFGCVVSGNVLSAAVGPAGTQASLIAVAYMPGVLHVVRVAPGPAPCGAAAQPDKSAAAAGQPTAEMHVQSKGMHLFPALLSSLGMSGGRVPSAGCDGGTRSSVCTVQHAWLCLSPVALRAPCSATRHRQGACPARVCARVLPSAGHVLAVTGGAAGGRSRQVAAGGAARVHSRLAAACHAR